MVSLALKDILKSLNGWLSTNKFKLQTWYALLAVSLIKRLQRSVYI